MKSKPDLRATALTLLVIGWSFALPGTLVAAESAGLPVADLQRTSPVNFEKEILPVLKKNCVACHNRSSAESDVMLESPEAMFAAETDPALISRGKGAESQLFLVASHRSEPVMPPEDNDVGAKPLSPEELARLRLWIDQGARGGLQAGPDAIAWRPVPAQFAPIYAVAVSPPGDLVAAGRGNRVHLYHAPSKRLVAALVDPAVEALLPSGSPAPAHLDFVQSLAFTPDGTRLVSGGYRVAKIWRRTGAPGGQVGQVNAPSGALSAHGNLAAVGETTGKIQLFDVGQQKVVRTLEGHADAVTGLAFSTDGDRLASVGRDQKCRVWKVESGQRLAERSAPTPLTSVVWAAENTSVVAGGEDAVIRRWTVPASEEGGASDGPPEPPAEWKGHAGAVTHVAAVDSAGRQVVSAGADGSLRLWNVADGKQVRQLSHGGPVAGVAAGGQRIVSVGANQLARLFQTDNGQQLAEWRAGHDERHRKAAVKHELEIVRRYLTAAKGDVAAAEKNRTAAEGEIKKGEEEVKGAEADLAKKVEAAKNAKEKEAEKAAAEQKVAQRTVQASKDRLGRMQVALEDAKADIGSAQAAVEQAAQTEAQVQQQLTEIEQQATGSERGFTAAAVSADATTIAIADDTGRLHLLDLTTGAAIGSSDRQPAPQVAIAHTSNAQFVAVSREGAVSLWPAVPQWQLERSLGADGTTPAPADRVTAIAVSPDGRLVATGGGEPSRSGELMIWDIESGSLIRSIADPHSDTVLGLAFSPRGKYLASCGADRQMKIFEVATGELICTCEGHTHHVLSVAWRADGRLLATGGADKVVKIWSFPSGDQQRTIEGFSKEITSVDFLALTDNIVTGAGNGAVTTKTSGGGGGPTYSGTAGFVYSTDSSADGKTIAAGGERGTLWIWSGGTTPASFAAP